MLTSGDLINNTELRLYALDIAEGNKAKADRLLNMKNGTIKQWLLLRNIRLM